MLHCNIICWAEKWKTPNTPIVWISLLKLLGFYATGTGTVLFSPENNHSVNGPLHRLPTQVPLSIFSGGKPMQVYGWKHWKLRCLCLDSPTCWWTEGLQIEVSLLEFPHLCMDCNLRRLCLDSPTCGWMKGLQFAVTLLGFHDLWMDGGTANWGVSAWILPLVDGWKNCNLRHLCLDSPTCEWVEGLQIEVSLLGLPHLWMDGRTVNRAVSVVNYTTWGSTLFSSKNLINFSPFLWIHRWQIKT